MLRPIILLRKAGVYMDKKPLIVLTGPTAVGKTSLSIKLAKAVNGEIISADSMQVYRYMDIGTAKIKAEEMDGIPHYLIDEYDPDEEFNVFEFKKQAKKYIDDVHSKGKVPILVGGTGFYIQAILYDIDFTENDTDYEYRSELEEMARNYGGQYLHDKLREIDPESAKAIHPNNKKKVIRALEYYFLSGEKISDHNKSQKDKESPYNYCYFVLNKDRAKLYNDINKRVDIMLEEGLVEEVKHLSHMGYSSDLVSMKGLGYKEILEYLAGKSTFDEAINILKKETRHYAKRQITWFRREKDVIWINKDHLNDEEILGFMLKNIKEKCLS